MSISRTQRCLALGAVLLITVSIAAQANPDRWKRAWPDTDFDQHTVEYGEIFSGGVAKDQIPPIDHPVFLSVPEFVETVEIADTEPVVGLVVNGDAKAYPLRVMTWHEIVNDEIGGVPVAVTYCPLCNAAIVFERQVEGRILDFGTTGKLRNSDLVMYDRQTESWWQQFLGEAIVGEMTGTRLAMLPSRMESISRFIERHPDGQVLVPNDDYIRPYGRNPYERYDSSSKPFLYAGNLPEGIAPLARVVAIGDQAWSLDLLRQEGRVEADGMVITWEPGQNSALDTGVIAQGRDVGNVVAQAPGEDGELADIVYDMTFAFVFHAFRPEGTLHHIE